MEISGYFATLCIRPAEMRALQELPALTKDNITPIVLLAPWSTSNPLSKAIDRFEQAFGDRPYYIDVDSYYQATGELTPAKEQWQRLGQHPADIGFWLDLIEPYPNANPCILMAGQPIEAARSQIDWARLFGRSFCLRFNMSDSGPGLPPWITSLVNELAEEGSADYSIHFDFGWVEDALQQFAAVSGLIGSIFSQVDQEVPIGVSSTNFPRGFTGIDGIKPVPFSNRQLVNQLRLVTNRPRITYGDWAATKPRSRKRANPPKARIDFPLDNTWLIRRDDGAPVTFKKAAEDIVANTAWSGNLNIWGEQMIQATAEGDAFAIDTMPKMYQCRINIHLHRQAFHGQNMSGLDLDEVIPDDF